MIRQRNMSGIDLCACGFLAFGALALAAGAAHNGLNANELAIAVSAVATAWGLRQRSRRAFNFSVCYLLVLGATAAYGYLQPVFPSAEIMRTARTPLAVLCLAGILYLVRPGVRRHWQT